MSTIELTLAVRRALVKGIDRLYLMDRDAADEAERAFAKAGYVIETATGHPASEATGGYNAAGQHVYIDNDEWIGDIEPGDTLYFDTECLISLRTL